MDIVTFQAARQDFLDYCSSVKGFSVHTISAYRNDLTRAEQVISNKKLSKVTLADISRFIDSPDEKKRSAATRARSVATLRSFFLFCEQEYGGTLIDIREISLPKVPQPVAHALSEEETSLILDSFGTDDASIRDKSLCELLYATGARISEAAGLNVGDIDYDERIIRVFGKGSKERVVPISGTALEILREYHYSVRSHFLVRRSASTSTNALFLSQRGNRLTRQALYDIVIKAATRVGLEKKVWPHVFRHTFATHLLRHGADMRVVQELLGHASLSTTQRYTAVDMDHLRGVYERAHPRSRYSSRGV